LSGAAAVVPASPNVADSHQLDGARLVDRSSGVLPGVISSAPEYVADTAMQIGGRPHHLFIPIILSNDGSFLGVPGGVESGCFGAERNFSTRGADFDQAERFAAQLFPRRHDIHAFYMYELESPSVVVSGAVISDPPPPGWRASIVETAEELSGRAPGLLCWATAAALGGNGQRARISAIALARVAAFCQPSPAHGSAVIVGAMEECSLDPRPVLARARATPVPMSTVLERAKHTTAALRQALRVASEAPECTPDEAADLKEWLLSCRPVEIRDISPELQTQCVTASDPRLALLPYPSVPPVHTAPLAPLPPAPPARDADAVPWWATDWIHALKKQAYAALLRCLRETRAYLRIITSTDSDAGAHKPSFFACKIESAVGSISQKYMRLLGHASAVEALNPRLHGGEPCSWQRAIVETGAMEAVVAAALRANAVPDSSPADDVLVPVTQTFRRAFQT